MTNSILILKSRKPLARWKRLAIGLLSQRGFIIRLIEKLRPNPFPQAVICPLCRQVVEVQGTVHFENKKQVMDGWLKLSCGDVVDGVLAV